MGPGPSRPTFYGLCSKPFPIVFLGDDEVVHDARELSRSGPSFPELRPHFPELGPSFSSTTAWLRVLNESVNLSRPTCFLGLETVAYNGAPLAFLPVLAVGLLHDSPRISQTQP